VSTSAPPVIRKHDAAPGSTRLEALSERAMSELGMEIGPLVEEYGPHVPVPEVVGAGDPDGRALGSEMPLAAGSGMIALRA